MRKIALLIFFSVSACVAQPTPDQYQNAVTAALKDNGCTFDIGAPDAEERLAALMAVHLNLPAEALTDRSGPHFKPIDEAMSRLMMSGAIRIDEENLRTVLTDCP